MKQSGWALALKRAVDGCTATGGLVVLAPLIGVTAAAIRISLGPPIFFVQQRPGKAARPFRLVKFRTMTDERDARGDLLPDDHRLTQVGRVVRSLSLDELPQLWNVLRGDMSLVGPRPLLMQYLPRYSALQARRHDVLPGITGWAQVNGRNALSWEEKFDLDVWYADHWSPWLDAKILAATVLKVLCREGISGDGQATMSEFMGSPNLQQSEVST